MLVYCFGGILASGDQLPTIYTRCSPFVICQGIGQTQRQIGTAPPSSVTSCPPLVGTSAH